VGEFYAVAAGGGLSAGRFRNGPAGVWQQLTVASHSRKVISTSSPQDSATYSPNATGAQTYVEGLTPQTVSGIPLRGYNILLRGGWNQLFIAGSLHSGYRGNEIDRITVPTRAADGTQVTTQISHQPNSPPRGPNSGYAAGMSGYIYKVSFPAESIVGYDDQTEAANWQPFWGHDWTMSSWTPYTDVCSILAHAVQTSYPNGAYVITDGVLQCSATQPSDNYSSGTRRNGLVYFDWTAGKYKTLFSQLSSEITSLPSSGYPFTDAAYGMGTSGIADWNNFDQSLLLFNSISNSMNVLRWNPVTGLTVQASMVSSGATAALAGLGGADGHSGNGWLIRHLEIRKYLMLRQGLTGRAGIGLFLYSEDFGTGSARIVDLTASLPGGGTGQPFDGVGSASDPLTFCVDKNSRRVFWLVAVPSGIPRLYVSDFDHLMTWTQITHSGLSAWADGAVWNILDRQVMHFFNGYLILQDNATGTGDPGYQAGAMNLKRIKVDAGEDLPAMAFTRYDYRIQNFTFSSPAAGVYQLANTKHCNFARNPANGKHYYFAGDCGGSTSQCMASLEFSGNEPDDYTFAEVLGETSPLGVTTGTIRPACADDGYWFHVPTDSAWVAARGKFVWQRGGDGEDLFWNVYLRAMYGAADQVGTTAQRNAAFADGWDILAKYYIFDPITNTFPSHFGPDNTGGWTQDNGSTWFPDVWTAGNAASRNGYFDPTTGCVWRFYNTGSPALAKFDFVNQQVQFFNLATWVSPETSRTYFTSGPEPVNEAAVVADGSKPKFGHYDNVAGRWITSLALNHEHKAAWLNPVDGKLYAVDPHTGYLWCFETRATPVNSDGLKIPFYPVGNRIPLVGTFPVLNSRDRYPPSQFGEPDSGTNGEVRMAQFLVPFKGGLLFWGAMHHTGGTFGYPTYAFWRRLGYTGDWTVVSFPQEFAANSYSVASPYDINNSELVMLCGGGNYLDTPLPWPFFWRLT